MRAVVSGDYIIDLGEHYIKRSARNRTQIMTAGGVMQLTVNIARANRPRTPMSTIEIDYSKRWQHQHWIAIVSAYKSSPYFDYYADYLEPLFAEKFVNLVDLNLAITKKLLQLLALPDHLNTSLDYVEAGQGDVDLRPKGSYLSRSSIEPAPSDEYVQVFADRLPFEPNLSVLDLLFCEGPNAISFLR